MRPSASAWTFPFIIPATQPTSCGSQALARPCLETRPWTIAALPLSSLPFRPSTLLFRSLPPSQEHQPSADTPTKTLLKWRRLD
jgi:hypothetical protein